MKEHELNEMIDDNLNRLDGPERGDALRVLKDLPLFAVPVLTEKFRASEDPHRQGHIVEVIWELRDPQSLDFLFECLSQSVHREVWEQALIGIVTLGREAEMDRLIVLKDHMDDEDKIARTIQAIEFIGGVISNQKQEYIVYHGVRMPKGWDTKIEDAQALTHYTLGEESLPRVKFGAEQVLWDTAHPCEICGVLKGQYHVPGCTHEECPYCGNEAMTCRCAQEVAKEE